MHLQSTEKNNITPSLFISTCLPNACSPSDFFGEYANDDDCHTKDENQMFDSGDVAFLLVYNSV